MENDAGNSIFPKTSDLKSARSATTRDQKELDNRGAAAEVIHSKSVPTGPGNVTVNPSGPSTGTEGWGAGQGEAGLAQTNIGVNNPTSTDKTSEAFPRRDVRGDDLRKRSDSMSKQSNTANTTGGERTFRCADAGHPDCRWETSGRTETEITERVREHLREKHGDREWTGEVNGRIRNVG